MSSTLYTKEGGGLRQPTRVQMDVSEPSTAVHSDSTSLPVPYSLALLGNGLGSLGSTCSDFVANELYTRVLHVCVPLVP